MVVCLMRCKNLVGNYPGGHLGIFWVGMHRSGIGTPF